MPFRVTCLSAVGGGIFLDGVTFPVGRLCDFSKAYRQACSKQYIAIRPLCPLGVGADDVDVQVPHRAAKLGDPIRPYGIVGIDPKGLRLGTLQDRMMKPLRLAGNIDAIAAVNVWLRGFIRIERKRNVIRLWPRQW